MFDPLHEPPDALCEGDLSQEIDLQLHDTKDVEGPLVLCLKPSQVLSMLR